ncbi:flavin reductase family protein [Thauera chlorobenzoica]|uniref:NADH-FMN oxidoreductase RutF-like protein n=1 Tax=Thauera chlorobenzoica TaxID=96773 RepID=A0A1H5RYQ6_9RHOO|nr:flavin reductase family protein [Thauera chlorobenzoica]APR05086.1 NADH-FMN oxidoreductase RutF-like protein [Thauera chlorobenzoica]SEF42838.1 NADH-FMN oxidoreductase RutF, flavin reductase (DIM6/NTAB) family [Thauera chlorobenzoica]
MKYMPGSEKCPLPFSPFKACTVPRPIGWLSSISPDGVENLAPYSQWQNLTFDPPMVMFAANQYPDGRRKDTVINAEKTGWFVWNMVTWDLREAMNTSAMAVPYGESEIKLAGLRTVKADLSDVPMVADSPCHFECRYLSTHRLKGNSNVGTVDVVFAEVVKIHIKDEYIDAFGKLDIKKARPIARLGYYDYTVVDETFEMRIPMASAEEAAGLEGRP